MKGTMFWLAAGFVAGIVVGYNQEEELEDICRKSKRTKRKMMKSVHNACDNVCECLDLE